MTANWGDPALQARHRPEHGGIADQSRVLIAQPRLPEPVQQLDLTVKKVSSDYLIPPHLFSTWLTPDLHRTHGSPPVQEYRLRLKRP